MTTPQAETSSLTARTVAGVEVLHRAGTGPVVVALPGLGSSGWAFESLAEAMPEIDLHAVSLPGRGGSAAVTGEAGLTGHARLVARVLEELDLREVVVVGHSMGAYLAPVVAQLAADRVKHLVLVDGGIRPALPFFFKPGLVRLQFRKDLTKAKGPFADVEAAIAKARLGPMLAQDPSIRPAVVRMLDRELVGSPGARVMPTDVERCVADAVDTFFGPTVEPALAALTVPAHVLLAENAKKAGQKPFISDKAVAAAVAKQPLLKVTRLSGNHLTVLFRPEVQGAIRA